MLFLLAIIYCSILALVTLIAQRKLDNFTLGGIISIMIFSAVLYWGWGFKKPCDNQTYYAVPK